MKTLKSLISLSFPILVANVLQTVYQLTDTFWVGRLGKDAVASLSLSFPIIFFIISLSLGLAMAGSILVSHEKGKGDEEKIRLISTHTILLITFISVILSIIGYFLTPYILSYLSPSQMVFDGALSYLQISFIGMVFVLTYMAFQSIMRGLGSVKLPMYIVLITVLLNFILDPIFIFGFKSFPPLGVAGAALSTLFTQMIASVIGIVIMVKKRLLRTSNIRFDFSLYKKMLKIGIPSSLETSSRAFGMTVMSGIVAKLGTIVLAAYGIGIRILGFIIIPALAISMATSTLVGQSVGAGDYKRAKTILKYSSTIGFFSLSLVGLLVFVYAREISLLFIPNDILVVDMTMSFLRIISFTFGLIGVQMALNGFYRAIKKTHIPMILTIINNYIIRIPIVLVFMVPWGVWYSFLISSITITIVTLIIYFTRYRKIEDLFFHDSSR